MEHVFAFSLVVITLLQQCGAELPGSWYSANVISNGEFSPKPISEIFTTEPNFSTKNPIIVLPSSTSPLNEAVSTPVPVDGSSQFSTTEFTPEEFVSSTPSPSPTEFLVEPQKIQQSILAQPVTFGLPNQFPFQVRQQPSNPQQNLPNYIVIYQQAPQSIQNYPPTAPQQTISTSQPEFSSTFLPEFLTQSTFQPEQSTPQTSLSTFQPEQPSFQSTLSALQTELSTPQSTLSTFQPELSTAQPTLSTFRPELSTPQSTLPTFQPNSASTFPSNLPLNPEGISKTNRPETVRTNRQSASCNNPTGQPLTRSVTPLEQLKLPSLRIRMVAPTGSITNINVNPTAPPTTRRTTTTRRPTTTRTRRTKRNRNTYDGCVTACEGMRSPICASPLAQSPVNPDTLKGFPSICHMACHNSFRKNQYEMLVDGRCGRLRTRIRTVDSDKLRKDELNKAQYTIVESNPQTIVEFIPR